MTTRRISTVLVALSLGALSMTAQPVQHEGHSSKKSPSQPAQQKKGMPGDHMMMAMASEPHHVLAMAYQQNLATFAKSLNKQAAGGSSVNVEFAQSAVAEMRRSFDQMKQHHDAHMQTMNAEMHSTMSGMMQQMDKRRTELNNSLTALEQEVRSSTPDPKKVSALAASVSSHCDAMSRMTQMRHGSQGSEMKMKN